MSEFTPPWSNARMTPAQIRKYLADMKKAQELAKQKLDEAKANWEFDKEQKEVDELEKMLDNL